jgi:hypothetical protein
MLPFDLLTLAWQVVNLLLLVTWLALIVVALLALRRRQLEPLVEVLWTVVVILVPILGPLAFFVVAPGKRI